MAYDAIDALTERDYTPDYITTDTDIFLDGVVDNFIASFDNVAPYSTWETGQLFAFLNKQIEAVVLTTEGCHSDNLHDNCFILLDGIDRENFVIDSDLLQLAIACMPNGAKAFVTDGLKVGIYYTGEYERIGMPGFTCGIREFLRWATKPYAQIHEDLFGYAKSYAGIDEED